MNKKLLVAFAAAAVAASSASFAAEKQGFYVGGNLGFSRADDGDAVKNAYKVIDSNADIKNNGGFGWRALAGYNFSRNFAVEAGYTQFADNTFKSVTLGNLTQKVSAWDLVGKAALPIADSCWDVYAKGGVAYQKNEYTGTDAGSNSNTKFRPVAGVGAAYNFENGVTVDLSWTRVFGSGDTTANVSADKTGFAGEIGQPNSDLIAVGLIYNFQNWA